MRNAATIIVFLLVGAGIAVWFAYRNVEENNIARAPESGYLYIYPNSSFDDVFQLLQKDSILRHPKTFERVAGYMNYKNDEVPSGRYLIEPPMSNKQLVTKLRAGMQTPVNLTFNNARIVEDLSGKLASTILLDSVTVYQYLTDEEFIAEHGYTKETVMCAFIPNTYQVYWDITMDELMDRMSSEAEKFWNEERLQKAKQKDLTPCEVYTLASIIDKETIVSDEKPTIAGVYLNRLDRDIALQADPTVVFAVGQFDLRRVLNQHLEFDSPYNTYLYPGLPPGPIAMASISGIDAVLNAEEHEYIFFCAKPDGAGRHAFAKTLAGHNRNARLYRNWLSRNGIR